LHGSFSSLHRTGEGQRIADAPVFQKGQTSLPRCTALETRADDWENLPGQQAAEPRMGTDDVGEPRAQPRRRVRAHDVVVERQDSLVAARIALAARASEHLPIEARGLVAFGADDVQPAERRNAAAELDVGAAAGHVRRNRDASCLTRLRHDRGLDRLISSVENLVRQPRARQSAAQPLRGGKRARREQHGLLLALQGVRANRRAARDVTVRLVTRHPHDAQAVDAPELGADLARRARRGAEAVIPRKESLVSDPGERLSAARQGAVFLDLDHLLEPELPRAVRHRAAGRRVDDRNAAVANEIVLVAFHQSERRERLAHELLASAPYAPEIAAAAREIAERGASRIRELDAPLCRCHEIVLAGIQVPRELECRSKDLRGIQRSTGTGQDERHAALVDQHAVGFVDDAELEAREQRTLAACETIDLAVQRTTPLAHADAVAQVIEDEPFVAAIDDVGAPAVGALGGVAYAAGDRGAAQPE